MELDFKKAQLVDLLQKYGDRKGRDRNFPFVLIDETVRLYRERTGRRFRTSRPARTLPAGSQDRSTKRRPSIRQPPSRSTWIASG